MHGHHIVTNFFAVAFILVFIGGLIVLTIRDEDSNYFE